MKTSIFAGILFLSAVASAAVPPQFLLRGQLTDTAGEPVEGMRTLTLSLYTTASGGQPFYTEQQTVTVAGGDVTVALGGANVLDLSRFAQEGEVYLGVSVGDDAEMSPRVRMYTVPYAAAAAHVDWSGISGVPDSIAAGYQAGTGLTLEGNTFSMDDQVVQRRLSAPCGEGQALAGIGVDGAPSCVPVGAGGAAGACEPGFVVTGIDEGGVLQCAPDLVGPTYSADGLGLSLNGTTFSLVYGQTAGTVTEGNDPRLPPDAQAYGSLTYSWLNQWVELFAGNQGELLHTRPPADGPPYWGRLLTEEVPGGSPFYIWNQFSWPHAPQSAAINITGGGTFGNVQSHGSIWSDHDLFVQDTSWLHDVNVAGALSVGPLDFGASQGTPISGIVVGEVNMGTISDTDCPYLDQKVCVHIPDPIDTNVCATVIFPISNCLRWYDASLPVWLTDPSVFLSVRSTSSDNMTFAVSWRRAATAQDPNRIRIMVTRTDHPGRGWGSDVFVQYLVLD